MFKLLKNNCKSTEIPDATQFTIAARIKTPVKLQFIKTDVKKTPKPNVFKSANQPILGLAKSPSMMVTNVHDDKSLILQRSLSVPVEDDEKELAEKTDETKRNNKENGFHGSKVSVPKLDDDDDFTKFFTSIQNSVIDEGIEISDFDMVKSSAK